MLWRLITNYFREDGRSKFVENVGVFQSLRSHILGDSSLQSVISVQAFPDQTLCRWELDATEDITRQQHSYDNLKIGVAAKVIGCCLMTAVFDAGVLDM